MVAKLKVKGVAKTKAALQKYGQVGTRAVAAGLLDYGKKVLDKATRNAPYDIDRRGNSPPHIRNAGFVEVPSTGSDRFTVIVGFDTPHAYIVHETNKNYRIGGWKYLERAVDEIGSPVQAGLNQKVASMIKSGRVPLRHQTRKKNYASKSARSDGLTALRRKVKRNAR